MEKGHGISHRWLSIVGIGEDGRGGLCPAANSLIDSATLVVGGARHLALIGAIRGETLEWKKPFRNTIARILERAGEPVCVLASGDPFWFGAGAVLAGSIPPAEMLVLPAPSTFSLAAARLGWPLQSVLTIGLHTARPETLLRHLHQGQRFLALSLDGSSPASIGALLAKHGFGASRLHVLEAIGGPREKASCFTAREITVKTFGPLNTVAIEVEAEAGARTIPFAPGLPDDYFEHDGQITKREIRAITLSSLRPAPGELLWDIGIGSGSVAIEWLLSHPATRACGFEKSPERAARAMRNAILLGVPHLEVCEGTVPEILDGRADCPDAVFVGGGVSDTGVLEAAWNALKPGGRIVCNAVTMEGETALMTCGSMWGGALTRIAIEREHPVGRFRAWQPAMPVVQWAAVKSWP